MAQQTPKPTGKGRPTPTRKEREATRKRPIVHDKKADSTRRRTQRRSQLDREYQAMRTGDDRNMPAQHAGAPRRFARDFIDSRTTVAEFLLPTSIVALFGMMFLVRFPTLVTVLSLILLTVMITSGIEIWILIRRLRKKAVERYGEDRLPRFYRMYGLTRMTQLRRLRMPKPQVNRGEYPT